jgi:hypothetical protein
MKFPLTIGILTKEFTFRLSQIVPYEKKFGDGTIKHQFHVDFLTTDEDLGLSLDDFSERFIVPAVHSIAHAVPKGQKIRIELLELPIGAQSDAERYDGVAVRGTLEKINEYNFLRFEIMTA